MIEKQDLFENGMGEQMTDPARLTLAHFDREWLQNAECGHMA